MRPKRLLIWAIWTGMIALGSAAAALAGADDDGLTWEANLETAQRLARKSHRLVLIHFGGPWCPPCQRMEQEVFSKPGFGRELTASFVAVKIDPQRDPATAKKYRIQKVPSDVIITASGQPVFVYSPSPNTAAEYVKTMKGLAALEQPPANMLAASPVKPPVSPPVAPSQETHAQETQTPGAPTPNSTSLNAGPDAKSPNASGQVSGPLLSGAGPAADADKRSGADEFDKARGRASRYDRATADLAGSENSAAPVVEAPAKAGNRHPSPMRQTAAARAEAPAAEPPRTAAKKMPIALDGFCPVTLITRQKWQAGDRRWGAYHRGHLYLFAGEPEQKAFLAAPDDFTPAFNGLDPVLAVDHNQKVAGKREFGAFYPKRHGRVYLFSSDETFRQFERHVARYAGETRQARRAASVAAGTSTAQNPPRTR